MKKNVPSHLNIKINLLKLERQVVFFLRLLSFIFCFYIFYFVPLSPYVIDNCLTPHHDTPHNLLLVSSHAFTLLARAGSGVAAGAQAIQEATGNNQATMKRSKRFPIILIHDPQYDHLLSWYLE